MADALNYFDQDNFGFFHPKRTGTNFDLADVAGAFPDFGYFSGGIDQDLLINDLLGANKKNEPLNKFYYKKYVGQKVTSGSYADYNGYLTYIESTYYKKTAVNAKNSDKEDDIKSLFARLNTKIDGDINSSPTFRIEVDLSKSRSDYTMDFNYVEDTEETKGDEFVRVVNRDSNNNVVSRSDRRIIAVEIKTVFYDDFNKLCQKLGVSYERYLIFKFQEARDSIAPNDLKKLNNFYKQAPLVFLNQLTSAQLFSDLTSLLQYDKDKWFIDNSDSMIKALSVILSKEKGMEFLYKSFNNDPALIKDIYYYLDYSGNSAFHNNEKVPNKTIFASMLSTICNNNAQGYNEERLRTDVVFKLIKDYRVDSNVRISNDKFTDKYDLTQEVKRFKVVTENLGGLIDGSASIDYYTYKKDLGWFTAGETQYLHPLDMITLLIEGPDKTSLKVLVPAIFVKDLAHHREWKEIEKAIRIGIDVFIVAISIATLVSGPGVLLTTLSIIDLGLASADIGIQAFEEEIRKIKGGKEFLDTWEKVYFIGGFVTALPLLGTMLKNGFRVLAKVVSPGARTQLISMLKYTLQQAKNFPKFVGGKFEIITDYAKYLGKSTASKMQALANEGVFLIKGIREGNVVSEFFLSYKNVVLHSGSAKQIVKDIREIIQKGKNALTKYLERLYRIKSGTGGGFKYIDEVPSSRMVCQEEPMSCAAACIVQLGKDLDITITEKAARIAANTDEGGTFLRDIGPALRELFPNKQVFANTPYIPGFNTMAETAAEVSRQINRPWIANLKPPNGIRHAVLVDKIVDGKVYIRDPWSLAGKGYGEAKGVEAIMSLDDFEYFWRSGRNHAAWIY